MNHGDLAVYVALIAKDDVGYQILCRLNTAASGGKLISFDNLRKEITQFGVGHLFVISCNKIGPAAIAVRYEEIKKRQMKKLVSEANDIVLDEQMIIKTSRKVEKVRAEIRDLSIEKDELEKRALKNFSKKEEAILLLNGE